MKRPVHLELPSSMYPDFFRGNQATYMRSSIRELNRSMESIEKMIEKTKKLISHSKENSLSRQKKQKSEHGVDQEAIIVSIECSVRNIGESSINNQNDKLKKVEAIPKKQVILKKEMKNKYCRSLTGQIQLAIKQNSKSTKKRKQNHKISSPFKAQITDKKHLDTNFPSKLYPCRFSQSKSKQKSLKSSNPQMINMKKTFPSPSTSSKKGIESIQKEIRLNSASILIVDEQTISPNRRSNKRYRFKTDYSTEQSVSHSNRTPDLPCVYKRKIALKVRESAKQSQLISQRSNKSTLQSFKLTARQQLVDQLARLETVSTTDGQRKAKFRLKIKKYGFVERHLSQQEIWKIYDELVASNLPQIKWPIAIVETVYIRMGKKA